MAERRDVAQQATGNNNIQAIDSTVTVNQYQYVRPQPVSQADLDAAYALLEQLPLDIVPKPATLPPGSSMPLSANPLFVGRSEDLKALAVALKAGDTAAITPIAAATGTGGIGKTQLATEFVHRYGQFFVGGVFWLGFETAEGVSAAIATAGAGLDLRPDYSTLPLEDQVRAVLSAWQSALPRLLIFDNCEDEQLLDQWRPPTGGCRVLVTSRRASWNPTLGVTAHPLGILSRAESVALLRKHRPDLAADDTDLDAIAAFVGDLPLALQLAGRFLRLYQYALTPTEYLYELLSSAGVTHPSFQSEDRLPTRHQSNLDATIRLSYRRLDNNDIIGNLSVKLLTRAVRFAAGKPIPRDLLETTLQSMNTTSGFRRQFAQAITRLTSLGLLDELADGSICTHRIICIFVQSELNDEVAETEVETVLLVILQHLISADRPVQIPVLQPHLHAIAEIAQHRTDIRSIALCSGFAHHLHLQGDYATAGSLFAQVVSASEREFGPTHLQTATALNNLASLLQTQGNYVAARSLHERALAIREIRLGPVHLETAVSLNNLAEIFRIQRNYHVAGLLYRRALAIQENILGEMHPNVALNTNNLALLHHDVGDINTARTLYERALAIIEQYQPPLPLTATIITNLALLLKEQKEFDQAQLLLERALTIREEQLGPNHSDTATSLSNLTELLLTHGNYTSARQLIERSLASWEQVLGPEHPNTRVARHYMELLPK